MSFKKLYEPLKERLQEFGITEPTVFQKNTLSKIKGGVNLFGIAPEGSGKSTAIILSVIQKLKTQSNDDAPRALIMVKDKEAAQALEAEFKKLLWGTDLLMCTVYEEQKIHVQQDELYEGVDIVITTSKRLSKLYFLNSINLNKLEMFFVDDAELLFVSPAQAELIRLTQSLKKCQYIVFAEKYDKRFDKMSESFMFNAQIITVE
jgi:superfamily II DNA/RNA helicase